MARITVLGGNGYVGAAVVAEARKRGHDVTAVSRSAPSSPVAGADYVEGSVLDADVLERTTAGRDVVLVALSPRGDMAGKVEGVVEELIARLAGTPTRLGYVGGASSLLDRGGRTAPVGRHQGPGARRGEARGADRSRHLRALPGEPGRRSTGSTSARLRTSARGWARSRRVPTSSAATCCCATPTVRRRSRPTTSPWRSSTRSRRRRITEAGSPRSADVQPGRTQGAAARSFSSSGPAASLMNRSWPSSPICTRATSVNPASQ